MKVYVKFISIDDEQRYATISIHVNRQSAGTLTMPRRQVLDFVELMMRGSTPIADTDDTVNFAISANDKRLLTITRDADAIVAASMSAG